MKDKHYRCAWINKFGAEIRISLEGYYWFTNVYFNKKGTELIDADIKYFEQLIGIYEKISKMNNIEYAPYNIRFTKEERRLLDIKSQQYGYKYVSDYIRDCCLYESVIEINMQYTSDTNKLIQDYSVEISKFTKEVRRILKYATSLSPDEIETLQQSLYRVYSQTKSLKKVVNENINVDAIIKQSKEKIYKQQIEILKKEFDKIKKG